MQMVISHAYTKDAAAADAYIALSASFDGFLAEQDGFVSRTLVQLEDDPTHLINLRVFRSVDDYEAMTTIPAYRDHIAALSELVDVDRYADGYPRSYADVVVTTVDAWRPSS